MTNTITKEHPFIQADKKKCPFCGENLISIHSSEDMISGWNQKRYHYSCKSEIRVIQENTSTGEIYQVEVVNTCQNQNRVLLKIMEKK